MKYLKIENEKGYYWNGNKYVEIDKINKDDLLNLLNFAETESFDTDTYDQSLIGSKAQQIIYENISLKFTRFLEEKDQFKMEAKRLYENALNKYKVILTDDETSETNNGVNNHIGEDILPDSPKI